MLNWLEVVLSLLRPPGISILISIYSFYYCIRSAWLKALLGFFVSISLLYLSSITLVADRMVFTVENKYKPLKIEDLYKFPNMNGIVAIFSNSYLSSDVTILQNIIQLFKETKLPIVIINFNNNRLYGINAELINSYIEGMLKSLDPNINVVASISVSDSIINYEDQVKSIQEILEQKKIKNIFLISDSWNVEQVYTTLKRYETEIVLAPVMSNVNLPKNNDVYSYVPNTASLLKSELITKIYLNNFINKSLISIKKIFRKT